MFNTYDNNQDVLVEIKSRKCHKKNFDKSSKKKKFCIAKKNSGIKEYAKNMHYQI